MHSREASASEFARVRGSPSATLRVNSATKAQPLYLSLRHNKSPRLSGAFVMVVLKLPMSWPRVIIWPCKTSQPISLFQSLAP
jgi:hypothetical protein